MLKFNKDSWFSCNNAMLKAKKTAQFMDGVEMTSPNLVLILQIRSQTLIKLYFLKDTNFWDATIASLSFTTKKQGKSAWTQHFKANSHGNLCSGMFSTFGLSMLQETTWWFCVLFKRITFPNNWVKPQFIIRRKSWELQRTLLIKFNGTKTLIRTNSGWVIWTNSQESWR